MRTIEYVENLTDNLVSTVPVISIDDLEYARLNPPMRIIEPYGEDNFSRGTLIPTGGHNLMHVLGTYKVRDRYYHSKETTNQGLRFVTTELNDYLQAYLADLTTWWNARPADMRGMRLVGLNYLMGKMGHPSGTRDQRYWGIDILHEIEERNAIDATFRVSTYGNPTLFVDFTRFLLDVTIDSRRAVQRRQYIGGVGVNAGLRFAYVRSFIAYSDRELVEHLRPAFENAAPLIFEFGVPDNVTIGSVVYQFKALLKRLPELIVSTDGFDNQRFYGEILPNYEYLIELIDDVISYTV
jgi:hypothetical protein